MNICNLFNINSSKIQKTYKSILDTFYTCAILVDKNGIIKYANTPAHILFGYEKDELINNKVNMLAPFDFITQHSLYMHHKEFEHLKNHDIEKDRVIKGQKKDGTIFSLDIRLNPVYIGKNTLNLMLCYEHNNIQQFIDVDVDEKERGYDNGIGTFEYYVKENSVYTSKMYKEITGLETIDTLENHLNIICREDVERVKNQLRLCLLLKCEIENVYRVKNKDDTIIYIYTKAIPLIIDDNVFKITGTYSDLTKNNFFENKFFSNVSSDLKNLLTSQISICKLLEYTELKNVQDEYLNWIKNSIPNILTVLNGVLRFSRAEKSSSTLNIQKIKLTQYTDSLLHAFSEKILQKNLKLNCDISENVPKYIYCDIYKIIEILIHFIENSIKFTEKGTITIDIDKVSDYLFIKVSDTGKGLVKEYNPFEQKHNIGIGLVICKKLTSCMNGNIDFNSNDDGSSFWINIPIQNDKKKNKQ